MKCPYVDTNSKYTECLIDKQTCFGFEKEYFNIEYCHKYQKARAEKAEGELKAIKARIDGINAEFINKIIEKNYYGKTLVYAVEIAKEIKNK